MYLNIFSLIHYLQYNKAIFRHPVNAGTSLCCMYMSHIYCIDRMNASLSEIYMMTSL